MSAPSAPLSRPSKTNRADPQTGQYGPSRRESLDQPLTEIEGLELREEAHQPSARDGMNVVTWREAVWRWRQYIDESRETASVFENPDGDRVKHSTPNRFVAEYADQQYAKLKDLERGLRDEYGKRLHTVMLTLTASTTDETGDPIPPIDHLEGLLESWDAVRRAMQRCVGDRRFERLAILEPHKSGYLHVHIAVFVDGVVTREQFFPAIESHVENCELAGWDAHDLEDEDTISVQHVGTDRTRWRWYHSIFEGADYERADIENLGSYLAEYLGTYSGDPLDAPEQQQMADAVLWLTGRQRWRPSNGAQQYMAQEESDEITEWEFVGVEDGDGEIHEVESGGGVTRIVTRRVARSSLDSPPPD